MTTTPGPWYVRRFSPEEVREANYIDIVNIPDGKLSDYPNGWLIAEIDAEHPVDIANAHLLAAAPSLLEALEDIMEFSLKANKVATGRGTQVTTTIGMMAQDAIQLAKGETP